MASPTTLQQAGGGVAAGSAAGVAGAKPTTGGAERRRVDEERVTKPRRGVVTSDEDTRSRVATTKLGGPEGRFQAPKWGPKRAENGAGKRVDFRP